MIEALVGVPVILQALVFFFLGALGVGLPTMRTLSVIKGNYLQVIPFSLLGSVNLFIFTWLVVEKNWLFIICNSIGAAVAVSYIAYRESKKNEEK